MCCLSIVFNILQYYIENVRLTLYYKLSLFPCSDDFIKWTVEPIMKSTGSQPPPKELSPFMHSQGPSPRTQLAKGPLEVFQLFFTVVIFGSIVEQTKLFAIQKGKKLVLCVEKLMAFLRINIAMGMMHLPQVSDYWSTNKILATPWFSAIMARDRFYTLLRYLHLVDSTLQEKKENIPMTRYSKLDV